MNWFRHGDPCRTKQDRLRNSHKREYSSWMAMRRRCRDKNRHNYQDYGGRGITVCDAWSMSFKTFLEDVGPIPTPKHTLDRIDNSKGYSPENCRWSLGKEQHRNKRSNKLLTYQGRTQTATAWSEELGIPKTTIHTRLKKGFPIEVVLTPSDLRYVANKF